MTEQNRIRTLVHTTCNLVNIECFSCIVLDYILNKTVCYFKNVNFEPQCS